LLLSFDKKQLKASVLGLRKPHRHKDGFPWEKDRRTDNRRDAATKQNQ